MAQFRPSRRAVLAGLPMALAMPATRAQSAGGARLRIAVPTYPDGLEPVLRSNTPHYRTIHNCFDGLLRQAPDGVRTALATGWQRRDGRTLDLTLREGVVFHDGRTMTVEDVLFSFSPTRLLGPAGRGETVAGAFTGTIERVEAIGPMAVRVTTKDTDPLLEKRLAAWSAQIVSRAAFDAAGGWEGWARAPIGAGPYAIAEARTDELLRLRAHEAYWGGRPRWESLEFRVVPEATSRMNALLSGEADLVVDLPPDQMAEVERHPELEVLGGPITSVRMVNFNAFYEPLRDPRVRRAMSLAVDRDAIIGALWGGRVEVPRGFQFPVFGETYIADFPAPRFDPDAARRLLREAGYAGAPIEYRIFSGYYTNEVPTAQVLLEMWRAVGLNVQLRMVENFGQMYQAPIDGLINSSQTVQLPDPLGMMWRSYGPGQLFHTRLGIWRNEEYDRLGTALTRETDGAARRAMHRRMLEISVEEDPIAVILHTNGVFYGARRGLGWRPGNTLTMDFGPNGTQA